MKSLKEMDVSDFSKQDFKFTLIAELRAELERLEKMYNKRDSIYSADAHIEYGQIILLKQFLGEKG